MMMRKRCPYCKGQGAVKSDSSATLVEPCPVCGQRGYNLVPSNALTCALCQGSGRLSTGERGWRVCPDCGGIGSRW